MSKHIVDKDRNPTGASRTEQFTKVMSADKPSPQSKKLQRQPLYRDPHGRTRWFLKIKLQNG